MDSAAMSIPEKGLKGLQKLAKQLESEHRPGKIQQAEKLAGQYVAEFLKYTSGLEKAQKESSDSLAQRQAELKRREDALVAREAEMEAAAASLQSAKTLEKIKADVGKINDRDNEYKKNSLSSNEKMTGEIEKTRTKVTESEDRLSGALQTSQQACLEAIASCDERIATGLADGIAAGVESSLKFSTTCVGKFTMALSTCETSLAVKLDETCAAVSDCEGAVNDSVSSCRGALLQDGNLTRECVSSCERTVGEKMADAVAAVSSCKGMVEELKKETEDSASSRQQTVLAELSSCKEAVTSSGGALTETLTRHENYISDMGNTVAEAIDELGSMLRDHVSSAIDSKSKESVAEVKSAVREGADKLSAELKGLRTEFASLTSEDRLKSVFEESSRTDEVLERLGEVKAAIPQPDPSLFDALSELKRMLEGMSQREGEREKKLADAIKEAKEAKADLAKCRGERDQFASELDQLKAKVPDTPRRSDRDSGSDEAGMSPGSDFEQEMARVADEAGLPSGPSMADLQKKVRELEEELRLCKESRTELAENSVSKNYLDGALEKMVEKLSLRDEQASHVAELEKQLQASAKRADDAEAKSGGLQSTVTELSEKVAALEAAAQDASGNRSRKRSRLLQDTSSSSERPDEPLFKSMCSTIHKAMDEVRIEQPDRPGLSVADIILSMTRALAFADREERLMRFIKGDQTRELFCFACLVLSDEPSSDNCLCHRLHGSTSSRCLSLRVLDNNTMKVEFCLEEVDS